MFYSIFPLNLLPRARWDGYVDGLTDGNRQGSIGEVSVVRKIWNLGGSQHSNMGAASNNNLEYLDSEAIAGGNDEGGSGGGGGEAMPVTNRVPVHCEDRAAYSNVFSWIKIRANIC